MNETKIKMKKQLGISTELRISGCFPANFMDSLFKSNPLDAFDYVHSNGPRKIKKQSLETLKSVVCLNNSGF